MSAKLKKASEEQWNVGAAAHLLYRAGFGGTPEQIRKVHEAGLETAIDRLIEGKEDKEHFPPPGWVFEEEENLFEEMRRRLQDPNLTEKEREQMRREALQARQREERRRLVDTARWWFARMLNGSHPLREKMTLFWHGHFATSFEKVRSARLMLFQNYVLRHDALGDFRELTKQISMDPAMMIYLDTQTSKRQEPNENFARELMELFTLGEGHYAEQDIKEAARAFTGYRMDRRKGEFVFADQEHDWGEKSFLGRKGEYHGNHIIDIILEQDQCGRYITRKIWEFFVYEDPSEEIVESLAQVFRDNDYEVKPLMRKIFESAEFYSEKALRTQIKSPIDFLVKLCKQLEIEDLNPLVLGGVMDQLGQILFLPPNVAGWEGGRTWINTNTLLTRYNVAGLLVRGAQGDFQFPIGSPARAAAPQQWMSQGGDRLRGMLPRPDFEEIAPADLRRSPEKLVDELAFRLFQQPLAPEERRDFEDYAASKGSDGFTDREVAELIHLMMSTPRYQLT